MPWIAAGMLFVVYDVLALARVRSLDAGADLASFKQAAWLIAHSKPPDLTITGNHLLADQAPFAFYPVAWATRVLPRVPTLLAVQAAGLALGMVPLWRIARRLAHLRVGAASALLVAYALFPALDNLDLADFHPAAPAVAALLGAVWLGLSARWRGFAVLCVLAVLCRADLALAVAGLGGLLVVEGHRKQGVRTIVAASAYLLLAVLVIQPHFGDSGLIGVGAFARYGDSFFGVAGTMLTHPVRVVYELFAAENLDVVILLFAPLLFLPLLAPRYIVPVLPLEALYLLADVPHTGAAGSEYTVAATVFVFTAAAFALSRMGRRSIERVFVDRRILGALVIASFVFFARDAMSSPYDHPWAWGRRDAADGAREEAARLIPDGATVRASPAMLPLLAERPGLYALPPSVLPNPGRAVAQVDYVVLDAAAVPDWEPGDLAAFARGMAERGFVAVSSAGGVEVYVRGG